MMKAASLVPLLLFSLLALLELAVSQGGIADEGHGGVCAIVNDFEEGRHKTLYTVGVLAIRGFEAAYDEFNKTFTDYLTLTAGQRFDPPIQFEIKPLNFLSLFSDTEASLVDFLYVNPSAFSCIESEYTARSLASQISRRNVGGNVYNLKKFGGVIMARADRDDIESIYDLEDKIVAAASISGLGSGQMQFLEMQRAGMSYINDPKQLVFTSNQGKVVNGVLSGQFDVGFVRTDQLERTKDSDGNLVNLTDFKLIEPRTNFIDGVEFPFTASTPLYPEWNVAALDHVPDDVSREVQTALLAIANHALVGEEIQECLGLHNETFCEELPFPHAFLDESEVRCDTNYEVALTAMEAMGKGKYSGWQFLLATEQKTTLSYMQLRSMQEATGFIKQDEGTNIWRCIRSKEIYDAITCPSGFDKQPKESVETGCAVEGLICAEGYQCLCNPCMEIKVCLDGINFGGDCVSYKVFLPSLLVPIFVLILGCVHLYVSYKRKMADSVWEVDGKELAFEDPVNIIGTGTFGYVMLAEYRGTQVAVKRILPAGKKNNMALDPHSDRYESNPGLRSVAPRMARKALRSGTLSGSSSASGPINVRDRREILRNFVLEMRHIAMLRHPCITTVMGAVLRADEPMLVLEYMQLGSLYDVLRNETLENQLEENKMQILQDISRGMRFLHAADPRVVHGDLKARNVLVDSNFRAKVSDFGLSPNQRTASGTPYWMAPELLESRSSNSARSDIFAFGILMFEIFSRSNPYINERDPDIVLSQICDHGVNKRPTLPDSCPLKMVDLFEECVKWDPTARPTAEAIDLLLRVEGSVTERVYRLEALNRELAEANAKIASASAMQLEHFACMSHEIRTPLNCIVGIASLMEDSDLKPCEQDNVNMIVGSGKLLRHIVDDVLDYSKLESGAMEVDIKPSNLQDVLVASVDSMTSSSITQKRNISIRTYYDPRLMSHFETDSRRLTQIFYNLLSNAVKFSKEDGVVEMSAKLIDPKYDPKYRNDAETHPDQVASKNILRLTVKDYGKGIDASDFESIFLPFSQTKTGINNTEGGTGLGLSITRKLVTGLGGYLSVNSQVGTFSEFTVDFPHPGDLPDLADFSRRLKQVSIVLIDENSLEVERVKDIFRTYDVAFSHFESHDDMRRDLVTSPGRVYICLVRCQLFDNEVLESVFRGARWEIITFGESSRLRKSSHHFRSVSAVFPYNFMKYVLDLAERLHRKPVVRLSRENEPTPDELVTIWKDLKVLVAEDNMVNQKVCRRLLNRIGVQDVVVVANGQEAVNIDARQPFDLILMDMQMPVMDGLEATKLIVARNGPHPVPKVVFLSAHVSDSFKDMCMESGAVGYVPKPCTLGSLKKILTEVVMMPPAESSAPVSSRRVRFGDIPVV